MIKESICAEVISEVRWIGGCGVGRESGGMPHFLTPLLCSPFPSAVAIATLEICLERFFGSCLIQDLLGLNETGEMVLVVRFRRAAVTSDRRQEEEIA